MKTKNEPRAAGEAAQTIPATPLVDRLEFQAEIKEAATPNYRRMVWVVSSMEARKLENSNAELLDMLTEARGQLVDLNQSENDGGEFLARLDSLIFKVTA